MDKFLKSLGISILVILFFANFQSLSKAQPADANNKEIKMDKPAEPNLPAELKFDNLVHDFGQIGVKSQHTCKFNFKNTGKGLLVIKSVRSTCGCTVPDLAKKEYAPGESGTIDVTFTAPAQESHKIEKHLHVQSNDIKNSDIELTVKADVVTRVKFEPEILKLSLKNQDSNVPAIKLTSMDGKAFSIKNAKSTADAIKIDFDPNASSTEFVFKPKIDNEKIRKILNGSIAFTLTHPECNEITIFFEALPVFTLNPPMIMVLKAKPGTSVTREVWVLNNYDEPFEIDSVTSEKGMVKLLNKEKQDKGYKLTVEIIPPESKVKIFSDMIFIKIKDGERLEINCRGFFENNPKKTK